MTGFEETTRRERLVDALKTVGVLALQAFAGGVAMAAGGYVFGRMTSGQVRLPPSMENVTPLRKVGT